LEADLRCAVVLFSNFPRAVANYFSPQRYEEFHIPGQMPSKPSPKVLTIIGGDKDYAMTFLHRMLTCCDGNGFKTYRLPSLKNKPFSRLSDLRSTASAMGIDYLYQDFDARMAIIAKMHIHSFSMLASRKVHSTKERSDVRMLRKLPRPSLPIMVSETSSSLAVPLLGKRLAKLP
jgi:hypothetical protein